MISKTDIKFLIRSKSLELTKNRRGNGNIFSYKFKGKDIFYRAGSSDVHIIYEILLKKSYKAEYYVPDNVAPGVIFDIGANIGIASIYFANKFPDAVIYCFEPILENFDLLKKNTNKYKNIHCFQIALGAKDGKVNMSASDSEMNYGGGSIYELGTNKDKSQRVRLVNPTTFYSKEDIKNIDLIKIDVEGSEYDVLTSFEGKILKKVDWIIGEMHGIKDFKLLDYLSSDFDISVKKSISNRLFMFKASNKLFTYKLSKEDKKHG